MTGRIRNWLFGRARARIAGDALAESVMAQARRPELFLAGFAEDTLDGRFAMVALHGALAIRHLRTDQPGGFARAEKMGEALFDRFDHALRENSVGDHSIARRMRRLGEDFYGLAKALDAALQQPSSVELEAVLARNGLGGTAVGPLAAYVRRADRAIGAMSRQSRLQGRLVWPCPRELDQA